MDVRVQGGSGVKTQAEEPTVHQERPGQALPQALEGAIPTHTLTSDFLITIKSVSAVNNTQCVEFHYDSHGKQYVSEFQSLFRLSNIPGLFTSGAGHQ